MIPVPDTENGSDTRENKIRAEMAPGDGVQKCCCWNFVHRSRLFSYVTAWLPAPAKGCRQAILPVCHSVDTAQMGYHSLCLTSVQNGAQVRGLQAAKVNISTPKSKDTGSGLRILPFYSAICYHL